MKRTTTITLISLLLCAGNFFTRAVAQEGRRHEPTGINLSVWKNVATQRTDTVGSTWFNVGIFSVMNRLNGVGTNLLGSVVRRDMLGIQLSGLANLTGGSMKGLQAAGITNVNGDRLRGISLAGLVSITGNEAGGLLFAGLANICGNENRGITAGGLLNICGNDVTGLSLAGLANIAGDRQRGLMLSGLLGICGTTMQGMQLSGLGNITGESMRGVQLSALGNVTGDTLKGVQIAPINLARRVKGVQIGLFNYYKEQLDGIQLGLVNANPRTRYQLMCFAGNAAKINLGVRFKNELFYTILGAGAPYLDFNDKFSASLFYRAGAELPLSARWFVSGDLGYQHIETFKNKDVGIPARLYALQARLNLTRHLNDRIGLFGTVGYGGSRFYNKGVTYEKGILIEAGIILL